MTTSAQTGYADVNGLHMYYEMHGEGQPLVLLHGGFGTTGMFGDLLTLLATQRQVIAVDLQAHGRTADIDRPMRYELMADDVAALIRHLGLPQADVMGYSLGGGTALRTAIQHPDLVRKLVVVSSPFSRSGWYPQIAAEMAQMNAISAEFLKQTPLYQAYVAVAPQPENFATLCDKLGDLLSQNYDWSTEVAALPMPVMIAIGDADSISPAYAAQFFALLGGGQRDGGWDFSGVSKSRLAIVPATTHHTIFSSPLLASLVLPFLDAPLPGADVPHHSQGKEA